MQNKHFFIMKKGLFVGSFNPITKAHEQIANDLLKNNKIDYLYFLPVNSNKSDLINISERINLINLIKSNKEEVLNIFDYSNSGFFNYNILKQIKGITHIIMGSDLFLKFKTFSSYEKILKEYYIIVVNRDTYIHEYVINNYTEFIDKIIIINKKYDGSSKLAKDNLLDKNNKYLNKKVLDYIKEHNLYN